jgi:cell division protease FtsH
MPPPPSAVPPSKGLPGAPQPQRPSWLMMGALLLALLGMWAWQTRSARSQAPLIGYSNFFTLVEQGKVKSVVITGQAIEGELSSKQQVAGQTLQRFRTLSPNEDVALLPLLRQKGVELNVASEEPPLLLTLVLNILPFLLIAGGLAWMSRRTQKMMQSGGPLGGFLKGRNRKFEVDAQPNVTLADVAGLKGVKDDLQEVVGFLKEPERFRRLGGRVPRGVLLIGPPGTGKTLLARAVAGESGVPFYSISATEFIEIFVGVGAARVRELFQDAKKNAPSIIFIDEIDAVGRSRGAGLGGGNDEREQTLNQLLSEMDGFSRNDLTIVMAATNRPDVLDPALLRPGRFDRRVVVDRPELEARRAILNVHVKNKPIAADVDLDALARNTPGFSGADLANLTNEAALSATRRGVDSIEARDFRAAYDKIVLGDLRESKLDIKEKHRVAIHEAGHAIVTHASEHAEPLHRISIIPRGMALGVTQQTPAADRHIMTQPELEARLQVLMGGYAAERVVLGDVSTGAENDLKEATKLATKMVANYGMSKKLGAVYYDHDAEHPFLGHSVATDSGTSDATTYAIEAEARETLTVALSGAVATIERLRPQLDALVTALLERESLEQKDLLPILGPSKSPPEPDPTRVSVPPPPSAG